MTELSAREGQSIPQLSFKIRAEGEWQERPYAELFAGKRVVLFALPGAYTPTCSSKHLPRYEALYSAFRQAGVDAVYCLSVNDAFVMEAWGRDQGAEQVELLPDGNGEFSRALGMLVDKRELGFGDRSWRYAAVIEDGVIEKLFVEEQVPGDPFQVSDADTVLAYLNPAAGEPFTLFTREGCRHCARAKSLLDERGARYEEIPLGGGVSEATLRAVAGASTVPQVFHQGQRIGGAEDLEAWLQSR